MSFPGMGGIGKIGGDMMNIMGDMASHNFGKMGQDFAQMMKDVGQNDKDCDDKKHHHHHHQNQCDQNQCNPLQEMSQFMGGMLSSII
ncbi:MAG: hypothetical protein JOY90_28295 [Bradyrhizobium sp.]|uniref:hypothetical protein n=1 Tax=Bradyrhizobium sp. TaxID=376 RepID=UPI001D99615B|nr:hypothetical protein [Bradyrhizobium sp.]MBV9564310.1 hypothetical protein [Bradyrhizobium sp.]